MARLSDDRTIFMAASRSCKVSRTKYTVPDSPSLMIPRMIRRPGSKDLISRGEAEELNDVAEPSSERSVPVVGRSSLRCIRHFESSIARDDELTGHKAPVVSIVH